jgi:hypothetical protein
MDFSYRLRSPLSLLLNDGDISCFLETGSRGATEVCEEFYDTLTGREEPPGLAFKEGLI